MPEVIKLGVLPDQEKASLLAKYSPLVDYLSRQTDLEIELVLSADYATMLDDFHAHRIDIANFGGLTFTEAERRDNAEPLVMRDTDLNFASCYLVPGADTRQTVRDFEGEIFAFGPELSTSGHLMPRYFLQAEGLDPETFFASVQHTSGHDETAIRVRDGAVDIGVANCVIVASMDTNGRLRRNEVRILETTPAYADYVWAIHENMDASIKTRLRDAFLALDILIPEHQEILLKLGANAYLPAGRADFNEVRRAARATQITATQGLE
jgi:phosphonate transport system substrate-binding protein